MGGASTLFDNFENIENIWQPIKDIKMFHILDNYMTFGAQVARRNNRKM